MAERTHDRRGLLISTFDPETWHLHERRSNDRDGDRATAGGVECDDPRAVFR